MAMATATATAATRLWHKYYNSNYMNRLLSFTNKRDQIQLEMMYSTWEMWKQRQ